MPDRVIEMLVNTNSLISWLILDHFRWKPQAHRIFCFSKGSSIFARLLLCLGALFREDVVLKRSKMNGPEVFEEVAKSLVGSKLPEAFRPPLNQDEKDSAISEFNESTMEDSFEALYPICLDKAKKRVTLYCSHAFCPNCIIIHGKEPNGSDCPICHNQLCQDLHNHVNRKPPESHILLRSGMLRPRVHD
jgi:hypothetical protein